MKKWLDSKLTRFGIIFALLMALALPAFAASWSSWRDGSNTTVYCQAGDTWVQLWNADGTKYQANVNYGIHNVTATSQTYGSEATRNIEVNMSPWVPGTVEATWDPDGRSYGASPVRPTSVNTACH